MSERKPLTDEQLDAIWEELLKPNSRKPLTLEELREMHDSSERVGTRVLLQVYSVTGIEGVLDCREDDGICAVYAAKRRMAERKRLRQNVACLRLRTAPP